MTILIDSNRWRWPLAWTIVAALALSPALARRAEARPPKVTPEGVALAVGRKLSADEAVPARKVHVAVADGVVTLTGEVGNLLAKERAARIARTIKGVRSVVNRIEVKPPIRRSNIALREAVVSALLWDPVADVYRVNVRANGGVVTLGGLVRSWTERRLTEKVVKGVDGVTAVKNKIEVAYQGDRPDKEIRRDVKGALRWDRWIDDGLISVNVDNGEVRLTGTVGSAAEKSRAIDKSWVNGVREVDASGLRVARWARDKDLRKRKYGDKNDGDVREAVERALSYDPRVNPRHVETRVADGVVTILGRVDNLRAKRAAGQDARNTVGAVEVRNRLKVRPKSSSVSAMQGAMHDKELERAVRNAVERDPYLSLRAMSVRVEDGVARLSGEVDSDFERRRAWSVAASIQGIEGVSNLLRVNGDGARSEPNPYVDGDAFYEGGSWRARRSLMARRGDKAVEEAIEDELFWSPYVDADEVDVTVVGGVATLTGTVDSRAERRTAEENAYDGGAIDVVNRLIVSHDAG